MSIIYEFELFSLETIETLFKRNLKYEEKNQLINKRDQVTIFSNTCMFSSLRFK